LIKPSGIKVVKPTDLNTMYEEKNIKSEFEERGKANPFRTPEGYFGSIEDRIMGAIEQQSKPKNKTSRMIRFLKPALGLAASFTLVYLLVYYPINVLLLKNNAKTEIATEKSDKMVIRINFFMIP